MKQESLAAFLVGTFSVCALAAMVLSAKYCFSARTLHRIQSRVMAVQSRVNVTQALLNETIDYSKRNPAVEQLLRSLNLKTNPVAAATAPNSPVK